MYVWTENMALILIWPGEVNVKGWLNDKIDERSLTKTCNIIIIKKTSLQTPHRLNDTQKDTPDEIDQMSSTRFVTKINVEFLHCYLSNLRFIILWHRGVKSHKPAIAERMKNATF